MSLNLTGGVADAGNQYYTLSGGSVVFASVQGHLVDPSTAVLHYTMSADVHGFSTNGGSTLSLSGTLDNGSSFSIRAAAAIVSSAYSMDLPVGCPDLGQTCTSQIPALFAGESFVAISNGEGSQAVTVMPVMIESAYDNPFGGPIIISFGTSGQITIGAMYTTATIQWSNVLLAGTVSGTYGTQSVAGQFTMRVNSFENLVSGTETDHGTIALQLVAGSTTPLNLHGQMVGTSIIPASGAQDCSALTGVPNTCAMTGLQSNGHLRLQGDHVQLVGTYETMWSTPAVGFQSTVTAAALQTPQN